MRKFWVINFLKSRHLYCIKQIYVKRGSYICLIYVLSNDTCALLLKIHLNCLLFVHRLAEESRINACESKSRVITNDHILAAAKVKRKFSL